MPTKFVLLCYTGVIIYITDISSRCTTVVEVENKTCATPQLPSGNRCMAGRQFILMTGDRSYSAALTIKKITSFLCKRPTCQKEPNRLDNYWIPLCFFFFLQITVNLYPVFTQLKIWSLFSILCCLFSRLEGCLVS